MSIKAKRKHTCCTEWLRITCELSDNDDDYKQRALEFLRKESRAHDLVHALIGLSCIAEAVGSTKGVELAMKDTKDPFYAVATAVSELKSQYQKTPTKFERLFQ